MEPLRLTALTSFTQFATSPKWEACEKICFLHSLPCRGGVERNERSELRETEGL